MVYRQGRKELRGGGNHSLTPFGRAFTLAEILVTLGIIGVVAALTMPSLILNHQKKVTAVRVKKTYFELYQAIKLSEIDNGPVQDWDFGTKNVKANTKRFVSKYIQPYYKSLEICSEGLEEGCGTPISGEGINYKNGNGTNISIVALPVLCNDDASILRKINKVAIIISFSNKKEAGKDWFYFEMNNGKLMPHGWKDDITREEIINGYENDKYLIACNNSNEELSKYACTALLMFDGWQIKDDYPW